MTGPLCQSRVYPFGGGWRLILGTSGEPGAPRVPPSAGEHGEEGWWAVGRGREPLLGVRVVSGWGSLLSELWEESRLVSELRKAPARWPCSVRALLKYLE